MTSQPNQSTVSLQSTTTVSSSLPLRRPQHPPKDYEAALAALQSRYGNGGHLPNPKKEASKKLPGSSQTTPVTTPVTTPNLTPGSSQITLTHSSISESSEGSSSTNSGGQPRRKSKGKKSILKSLFKGKAKDTDGQS
ncbi:hypothetical protein GALMADRAFT_220526 [Galerina marginata CBS 339.88]|uniref:Uncharacterized protein n=1 Tax=Galerina marginata (strain CBS 339.88) TaxID=685588 RepID=A0A067TJP5_GALM3|nr:hypothetical protein GALMADRAFT_220526 [Galerina marginata CBS 339.88]